MIRPFTLFLHNARVTWTMIPQQFWAIFWQNWQRVIHLHSRFSSYRVYLWLYHTKVWFESLCLAHVLYQGLLVVPGYTYLCYIRFLTLYCTVYVQYSTVQCTVIESSIPVLYCTVQFGMREYFQDITRTTKQKISPTLLGLTGCTVYST